MFNPERLLGSLLGSSSSGMLTQAARGAGVPGKAGALALLGGVAIAAVEHFSRHRNSNQPPAAPASGQLPPPPPGGIAPPPPPPPGGIAPPSPPGVSVAPPLPPIGSSAPPSPPGAAGAAPPAADAAKAALLLVRAMIAAAKADGVIDAEERRRIDERLGDASPEERAFVAEEMNKPLDLDELLAVADPALGVEIYTCSLLAIELDTSAEVKYLKTLSRRLGLDETTVNGIHDQLGVVRIFG